MKLVVAVVCFALRCEGLRLQKPESDSSPVKEASVCVVGDVHFGGSEETDTRFKQVAERIAKKKCAAVVLLGDLSENGKVKELKVVKDKLGKLSGKRILAIPGNHDIHVEKDKRQRNSSLVLNKLKEFITTFGEDHHVLELPQTTIVVANSEVLIANKEKFPALQEHRESSWAKLEESLRTASEKKGNIVLITHRPLIKRNWEEAKSASNWPVEERNRLLAMLPPSSTTHVLAGHTHRYTSLHYEASGRKIEQETMEGTAGRSASFAEITVQHDGRVRTKMIPVSNGASPIFPGITAPLFSK